MRQFLKKSLQPVWPADRASHCILVYHSVSTARYSVHPDAFRQQMQALRRCFDVVPLPHLLDRLGSRGSRCASITFDDGFEDNFTTAWPILRSLDISPAIFITTSFVGERRNTCNWSPHYQSAPAMIWSEVALLASKGVIIGAHTCTHPRLADCADTECHRELARSRAEIESRINSAVDLLAYPFGQPHDFKAETERIAQAAGYRYAFTTLQRTIRPGDRRYALPRITIDAGDTMDDFIAKVEGRRNYMAVVDNCRAAAVRAGFRQPLARCCSRCEPAL